jgi:hypothetical protein
MLDGSALPKTHSQPPKQALAGRLVLSPQTWQAVLIVLGIAVATFVLYLYVLPNSQIDAARVRIADLQAQKATLERENAALMQEIARASNLKTLEIRARALGMGPATSAIYLRLPDQSPTPAVQPAASQADSTTENALTTLTEWLQREHLQEWLRDLRWRVSQAVEGIIQRFQRNS